MIMTPNKRNWIKIGTRTFISRNGDTVKFIDREVALINDRLVKGSQFIRNKIIELGRR